MAQCSVNWHLGLVKLVIFLKLLQLRIMELYPIGAKIDDIEPLEDQEGGLFIIEGKATINEEKTRTMNWDLQTRSG